MAGGVVRTLDGVKGVMERGEAQGLMEKEGIDE